MEAINVLGSKIRSPLGKILSFSKNGLNSHHLIFRHPFPNFSLPLTVHLIHPSIRLKANVEAGGEEEACVPVVDDHDVEDDLRHPEHIWESRSRLRSFEEGEHSVYSENSIQPQGHRAGHLVDTNMKIVHRFGNSS